MVLPMTVWDMDFSVREICDGRVGSRLPFVISYANFVPKPESAENACFRLAPNSGILVDANFVAMAGGVNEKNVCTARLPVLRWSIGPLFNRVES